MRFLRTQWIYMVLFTAVATAGNTQGFIVKLPADLEGPEVHGRVLVMLSTDDSSEPRFQISDGPSTQLVFGEDVVAATPGANVTVDNAAFGYPIEKMSDNLKEVKPNVMTAVPRLYEKVFDKIYARGEDIKGIKQKLHLNQKTY